TRLLVSFEAAAEAFAGVTQVIADAAGAHRLGHLLPAGATHLAQVAFEDERRPQHHQEAAKPQQQIGREGDNQKDEAGDEPERGPLEVAARVAEQRGGPNLVREGVIALVELLPDLMQDPLLFLGKRHALPLTALYGASAGQPSYDPVGPHC